MTVQSKTLLSRKSRPVGSPADNPLNRIKTLLNVMKGGNILRKGCSDEDCTFETINHEHKKNEFSITVES